MDRLVDIWKKIVRGVLTQMRKKAVADSGELPVYYIEWNSLAGMPFKSFRGGYQ